jgi:hypothetical protein
MESQESEQARRNLTEEINAEKAERAPLEEKYGQVWNTSELQKDFSVEGFGAPCVVVTRKADNVRGTLTFQHMPRYYFDFQPA